MPELKDLLKNSDDGLLDDLNEKVWLWYDLNQNDVIFTFKKWFISFDVRVKNVRIIFERIFGPRPA